MKIAKILLFLIQKQTPSEGHSYCAGMMEKFEHGCGCQFGYSSSNITYNLKYKNVAPKIFSLLQSVKDESG